jgi:hypothetical protein
VVELGQAGEVVESPVSIPKRLTSAQVRRQMLRMSTAWTGPPSPPASPPHLYGQHRADGEHVKSPRAAPDPLLIVEDEQAEGCVEEK